MQSNVRQTIFQVEPLQNVVGVGNTTAYQIIVSQGSTLGTLGNVSVPAQAEVLNDTHFARNNVNGPGPSRVSAWLRSTLATLQA